MAELKPFEVIMMIYPIAGQNGKGEVVMKADKIAELIRCRDCKYYRDGLCDRWKYSHVTNADSFCSGAEMEVEE